MLIIIDGHNLVPKIPGMSLSDMDDEIHLISLVQEYARLKRRQVELFFDNPPPGQPRMRRYGTVVVKFSRPGLNADEEIRAYLARLGNQARNCAVVSSDLRVQAYGRGARAQVISSEEFACELDQVLREQPLEKSTDDEAISEDEVAMWMEMFGQKKSGEKRKS